MSNNTLSKKVLSAFIATAFFFNSFSPVLAQAITSPSNLISYQPPVLRYLSINSANPYNYFNFLLDKGSVVSAGELNTEAKKLINYFFLGLTLSPGNFWVNLKPGEADNISTDELSRTDMGKILLEQDLELKKDVARYLHPDNPIGKKFWEGLYIEIGRDNVKKAQITTSQRVWIVPESATVVETEDGAFISEAKLKVLAENEYLNPKSEFLNPNSEINPKYQTEELNKISERLLKQIVIPELSFDVNYKPKYAKLRQIYYSLVLAEYFKRQHLANTSEVAGGLLGGGSGKGQSSDPYISLINQNKTIGLESALPWSKDKIWQEYNTSYQKGEYNLRRDLLGLARMYFSGGVDFTGLSGSPITGATNMGIGGVDVLNIIPETSPYGDVEIETAKGDGNLVSLIRKNNKGNSLNAVLEITGFQEAASPMQAIQRTIAAVEGLKGKDATGWTYEIKVKDAALLSDYSDHSKSFKENGYYVLRLFKNEPLKEVSCQFYINQQKIDASALIEMVIEGITKEDLWRIFDLKNKQKLIKFKSKLKEGKAVDFTASSLANLGGDGLTAGSPLKITEEVDFGNLSQLIYDTFLKDGSRDKVYDGFKKSFLSIDGIKVSEVNFTSFKSKTLEESGFIEGAKNDGYSVINNIVENKNGEYLVTVVIHSIYNPEWQKTFEHDKKAIVEYFIAAGFKEGNVSVKLAAASPMALTEQEINDLSVAYADAVAYRAVEGRELSREKIEKYLLEFTDLDSFSLRSEIASISLRSKIASIILVNINKGNEFSEALTEIENYMATSPMAKPSQSKPQKELKLWNLVNRGALMELIPDVQKIITEEGIDNAKSVVTTIELYTLNTMFKYLLLSSEKLNEASLPEDVIDEKSFKVWLEKDLLAYALPNSSEGRYRYINFVYNYLEKALQQRQEPKSGSPMVGGTETQSGSPLSTMREAIEFLESKAKEFNGRVKIKVASVKDIGLLKQAEEDDGMPELTVYSDDIDAVDGTAVSWLSFARDMFAEALEDPFAKKMVMAIEKELRSSGSPMVSLPKLYNIEKIFDDALEIAKSERYSLGGTRYFYQAEAIFAEVLVVARKNHLNTYAHIWELVRDARHTLGYDQNELNFLEDSFTHNKSGATSPINKLLIVDDDFSQRASLRRYFKGLGYEVVEAVDGLNALEVFDETPGITGIITDSNMPKMDGLALIWELVKTRKSKIPIIQMSDINSDLMINLARQTAKSIGAAEFLPKSASMEELRAALDKAIGEKTSNSPLTNAESELDSSLKELQLRNDHPEAGGIDLKEIKLSLHKYSAMPEEQRKESIGQIKTLLCVDALLDKEWASLAHLYYQEIVRMIEDGIVSEIDDRNKLIMAAERLKESGYLVDSQGLKFLNLLKTGKPLVGIRGVSQ